MKHAKKILSLLLTLVLLVGLLPGMSLTALAETEQSETIATTATTVNGNHFTISASKNFAHASYGVLGLDGGITVTPKNTEYITKVVITCGYAPSYVTNDRTTVSSGTMTITDGGGTITVTNVNASTFNFKCNSGMAMFNQFVVYYLDSAPVPVTNITLDKTSATLTVGGIQKLTASVLPENATDKTVLWNVRSGDDKVKLYSDENCQTEITQDTATGTLTVYVKGISAGSAAVEVASSDDLNKFANCTVTVNAPAASKYTVTYVANNGSGETRTDGPYDAGTTYTVESCSFAAPEGKEFDCWQGSDGKTYKVGAPVVLNANLTLTAQWKDKADGGSGDKKTGGSGSGFDIVFNIPGAAEDWGYAPGYAPQRAYRVSLAPMVNGSAALGIMTGESTTTEMNVYPTTTIYVFPNANPGFVLDKIIWSLIDGSASYDITETKNFVMPAMDAVVYVTFKPVG